MKNIGLRLRER